MGAPLTGRTVVFGGSFDPPHFGHASACAYLLDCLGAERVLLVPTHNHPLGKQSNDFDHRLAMCQRMAQPFGGRVEVSDKERELGGAGRTYDLLTALEVAEPETQGVLCVGADILEQVERWYRWDAICERVEVIVLGRGGYRSKSLPGMQPVTLPAISSSEVRAMLARGEPVWGWVPAQVIDYIEQTGLYGSENR
ncbi:MAG: nicotinate (nicotinamide) nucleotide adenylyltransferase [Myxococcota bacterium]|nr:nicotinate (nicotinamide) nucleotide adenylyltransferase [Myxococcota bacterium]